LDAEAKMEFLSSELTRWATANVVKLTINTVTVATASSFCQFWFCIEVSLLPLEGIVVKPSRHPHANGGSSGARFLACRSKGISSWTFDLDF
jgi:hypothetical protein